MFKEKSKSSQQKKIGQATQAIAAVIKEFGDLGFSVDERSEDELRQRCSAWIQHLLDGAPSPKRSELAKDWLDWPGVRDFMAEERQLERTFVKENLNELRELAWTMVNNFTETLKTEQESDNVVQARLSALKMTADVQSGEELKAEVFAAVQFLNHFLENRKDHIDKQIEELAGQVQRLRSELVHAKKVAEVDGLTGLYNRATFDDHVARVIQSSSRTTDDNILLLADIDHFKRLNDTYGHPFGDEVLRQVAGTMKQVFARETDFAARYGGEEFAIVASCKLDHASSLGERLLQTIRSLRFDKDGEKVKVTASLGIAALKKAELPEKWIERADKALYASKHNGRDQLTIDGR